MGIDPLELSATSEYLFGSLPLSDTTCASQIKEEVPEVVGIQLPAEEVFGPKKDLQ